MPRLPSRLVLLSREGDDRALSLNHDLGPWERAGWLSLVAECQSCGLFAVVDTGRNAPVIVKLEHDSGPELYGSAIETQCLGQYKTRPTWSTAHVDA